jgi:hypothetical protein
MMPEALPSPIKEEVPHLGVRGPRTEGMVLDPAPNVIPDCLES